MDLAHATRMIMAEAAPFPDLLRVTRETHDELAAGRPAPHTALTWMIREASRKDLYAPIIRKHGQTAFNEMVTVVCREIDRQSPVQASTPRS